MEQHDHSKCPNTATMKDIKSELASLREENTRLREDVAVGRERTSQIFEVLGEIKQSIKDIAEAVQKFQIKPDAFKEQVYRLGLKLAEYGIIAGIIYAVMNGARI